jgi:hypothetical protein
VIAAQPELPCMNDSNFLPALVAAAAVLTLATAAEARHSCGSSTKQVGRCTVTTTTLCEYRVVNGRRQEYIVGTQTSRSCPADASGTATMHKR